MIRKWRLFIFYMLSFCIFLFSFFYYIDLSLTLQQKPLVNIEKYVSKVFERKKKEKLEIGVRNQIHDKDIEKALSTIFFGDFGYTLIGAKPVSVEQNLSQYLILNQDKTNQLFYFLQQIFCQSNKFIFKILKSRGYIELIHKKSLLKQINTYPSLKAFVIKKYGTSEMFFKSLEDPEVNIFKAVDYNPVLTAIVLGYGEENGKFFVRKIKVGITLQKYPIIQFFPFEQLPNPQYIKPFYEALNGIRKATIIKGKVKKLEKEWKSIITIERDVKINQDPPFCITMPVYVSKYGKEPDIIYMRFEKAMKHLANLLYKKPLMFVVSEEINKQTPSKKIKK